MPEMPGGNLDMCMVGMRLETLGLAQIVDRLVRPPAAPDDDSLRHQSLISNQRSADRVHESETARLLPEHGDIAKRSQLG